MFKAYNFLNPHKEGKLLAAYIVGIAAGETVIFVIVRYVCVFRERMVLRYSQSLPSVTNAEPEALDDWEEIDRSQLA